MRGGGGGGRGKPSGIIAPLPGLNLLFFQVSYQGQPPVQCDVVTNAFKASFNLPEKQNLYMYRVDFENPAISDEKLFKTKANFIF